MQETEEVHESAPKAGGLQKSSEPSYVISPSGRRMLGPRVYEIIREHRKEPPDVTLRALEEELSLKITRGYLGLLRNRVDHGKVPEISTNALEFSRPPSAARKSANRIDQERDGLPIKPGYIYFGKRKVLDPAVYKVIGDHRGDTIEETRRALKKTFGMDISEGYVSVLRAVVDRGKIPEAAISGILEGRKGIVGEKAENEKGYLQKAEPVEPPEVAPAEVEPPAKIPPPLSLPKKESAPQRDDNSWKKDPRRRKGIYNLVARYRAADPESLPRLIFDRFGVELNVYQIGWIKREIREKEEGKQLPSPDYLRSDGESEDGEKITLETMTGAIRNSVGKKHAMEEEAARTLAEHVMNFFGYSDRMLDNVLEPEDRDLFYNLEDAGILTTEREETTLYDGREWRIHYWLFRKDRIDMLAKGLKEKERKPEEIYTGEGSADMWETAMLHRRSTAAAALATPAYGNNGGQGSEVAAGTKTPVVSAEYSGTRLQMPKRAS